MMKRNNPIRSILQQSALSITQGNTSQRRILPSVSVNKAKISRRMSRETNAIVPISTSRPRSQTTNSDEELGEIKENSDKLSENVGWFGASRFSCVVLFVSLGLLGVLALGGLLTAMILYIMDSSSNAVWKILGIIICATVIISVCVGILYLIGIYYKNQRSLDDDSDSEKEEKQKDTVKKLVENKANDSSTNPNHTKLDQKVLKKDNNQTNSNHLYANNSNNANNPGQQYLNGSVNHQYSNGESVPSSLSYGQSTTPVKAERKTNGKQRYTGTSVTTVKVLKQQQQSPQLGSSDQQQLVHSARVIPRPIIVQVQDQQSRNQLPEHTQISTFKIQPNVTYQPVPQYQSSVHQHSQTKQGVPVFNLIEQKQLPPSPSQPVVPEEEFYELNKFY
ncbi:unnamed protein product [Didymodactylos carnosus]|uniref:Transmembrane protein n=1 Tax=Didymodactylos carnosus TaxID=1234261 RepID=A0A8S2DJZ4_9BILA|nr:unnamed protein product [Didymodactylos carnosus]CAF3712911.1 unnamed protein product [Didymodactylos carnosus]